MEFWFACSLEPVSPLNLADVCIFALQRKMLKPPIARLPVIKLDYLNRPSGETNCIYEANVK